MTERAERIERIKELLEDRRHPERRVSILSATNLTRVAIRLVAMGLAAGLAHRLAGGTTLEIPLAAIAVGTADFGVSRLWRSIGEGVRRGWNTIGVVLAAALVLFALLLGKPSQSTAGRAATGWWNNLLESQRAGIDQRKRARRTPIDSAAAGDPNWRLLLDSGAVRRGTYQEARTWCADLGPEWGLPPGLGQWPELARWPDFGTTFYVWSLGGSGVQVGDGRRPGVGVSGSGRPGEVRAVLCLRSGA